MTKINLPSLKKAVFIKKINRFVALVNIDGMEEKVHIPSTGRLDGILLEGTSCFLKPAHNPNRKTRYSLYLIAMEKTIICVDSLLANQFVHQLLKENQIEGIGKGRILNEVQIGKDRLDFVIQGDNGFLDYIEVKSVNKSDNGIACFPDAPTERGRKHLTSLIEHQQEKHIQSHVVFVILRNDAHSFSSCYDRDPEFADLLKKSKESNVMLHACLTDINEDGISFNKWLPIKI